MQYLSSPPASPYAAPLSHSQTPTHEKGPVFRRQGPHCAIPPPAAPSPYSQAVKANGMLFVSGQIPIDPNTQELKLGSVEEQTVRSAAGATQVP